MISFNPKNWYWVVAGDASRVYSSARGAYFPADDASYKTWAATGARPTRIANEAELGEVLQARGLTFGAPATA